MAWFSNQEELRQFLGRNPRMQTVAKTFWRRGKKIGLGVSKTSLQRTMTRQERRLRKSLGIGTSMEKTLLDSKSFWLLWNVTRNVVSPTSGHGWTVLDVGASNGWYSKILQRYIPQADFKLFEPLSEYSEQLSALCDKCSNFDYLPMALGSHTGLGILNYSRGFDGLSSMFDRNPQYEYFAGTFDAAGVERREVFVNTLDNYLSESQHDGPVFLKLDCQGAEFDILRGAQKALSSRIVVVHAELLLIDKYQMGSSFTEVFAFMEDCGFVIFDINPTYKELDGMPDFFGFQGQLTEAEVIFVRSDYAPVRH